MKVISLYESTGIRYQRDINLSRCSPRAKKLDNTFPFHNGQFREKSAKFSFSAPDRTKESAEKGYKVVDKLVSKRIVFLSN